MDLAAVSYATWDDLRLYCYRVASAVGLVATVTFAEDCVVEVGSTVTIAGVTP